MDVHKLTVLCARKLVKDLAKEDLDAVLRLLFKDYLPAPVYSAVLDQLPFNRVLQVQELYPGNVVWKDWWHKLCHRCAEKDVLFGRKMRSLGITGNHWESLGKSCMKLFNLEKSCMNLFNYKESFFNAYFKVVLEACSARRSQAEESWMHSRNFLQNLLGECKDDLSNEQMLSCLAKHITQLTLRPSYRQRVKNLINSDSSSFRKVTSLNAPLCFGSMSEEILASWRFCFHRIYRNSRIQALRINNCLLLDEAIENTGTDMGVNSFVLDAVVGSESDANSVENGHDNSNLDLAGNSIIRKLCLSVCPAHSDWFFRPVMLNYLYGLKCLEVACGSYELLTSSYLDLVVNLLESTLSLLKDVLIIDPRFRTYEDFSYWCQRCTVRNSPEVLVLRSVTIEEYCPLHIVDFCYVELNAVPPEGFGVLTPIKNLGCMTIS